MYLFVVLCSKNGFLIRSDFGKYYYTTYFFQCMKKIRFISIFFLAVLLTTLLIPSSWAFSSEIVDSMEVNCGSCLLVDMNTNTVLYGQDNTKRIYPASVTKMLTALVVLQHVKAGDFSLEDTVTASSTFKKGLTSLAAVGNIQTGEQLSVKDLLYMLMLPSHCDAANVLAEAVSGSVDAFAGEMNQTAQDLGCTGSHFVNPSGLHNKEHYTTCDDLYLIAKAAYQYDAYRTIIGTSNYTVPATNLSGERKLHNTNALTCDAVYTEYLYDYCTGGKTGSTYPAGYCLLSYAEKDGQTLCCVMMGCQWLVNRDGSRLWTQYTESSRLYDWGFDNFGTLTVVEAGSVQATIPVTNARSGDSAELAAAASLSVLVPNDIAPEDFTLQADLPESIPAPVSAGDVVGTLSVELDGVSYGTIDLVSTANLDAAPKILSRLHDMEQTNSPFVAVLLLMKIFGTLLFLTILFFLIQAARRRHNRKRRRKNNL